VQGRGQKLIQNYFVDGSEFCVPVSYTNTGGTTNVGGATNVGVVTNIGGATNVGGATNSV